MTIQRSSFRRGFLDRLAAALVAIGCAAAVAISITWAVLAAPTAFNAWGLDRVAIRVSGGEAYRSELLKPLAEAAEAAPGLLCSPQQRRDALLLRSRIAELTIADGEIGLIEERFGDVDRAARSLLSCSPGEAIAWLALYWTKTQAGQTATAAAPFLRRSYMDGPHETWIQLRRNAMAISAFAFLPADLQEKAVDEFGELLHVGAARTCAEILAGPGYAIRDRLLGRIAKEPEDERIRLAQQLREFDVEVDVPGIPRRDRRWR